MEKDLDIKPTRFKSRYIYIYNNNRKGWLRFFGKVISWKDTSIHPLMFSERNGYTSGFNFGKWRINFEKRKY